MKTDQAAEHALQPVRVIELNCISHIYVIEKSIFSD